MRLKLYRAAGISQALATVRAELGPDALILATRRVGHGVEVTAAVQPEEDDLPELAPALERISAPDPARGAMLAFHGVPGPLQAGLRNGSLADSLAGSFHFAPLPVATGQKPLLFAGPPGAGKTLTVARLATRLVLQGAAPSIITADGRRAGATEQLAAFTRLLGLDLLVASNPVTLGRALTRREGGWPVLIDAPGADPFDTAQHDELMALATTAGASIVLTLPAGLDGAEAADLAGGFKAAGATMLVATRLDVSRRLGAVLAAAHAAGLALTEAGIGPGAADGLTPMTPDFLASRLLAAFDRTLSDHQS